MPPDEDWTMAMGQFRKPMQIKTTRGAPNAISMQIVVVNKMERFDKTSPRQASARQHTQPWP